MALKTHIILVNGKTFCGREVKDSDVYHPGEAQNICATCRNSYRLCFGTPNIYNTTNQI